MKTDEVCGRPRHPFGCTLPLLGLYCCFGGRKVHKLIRATIKKPTMQEGTEGFQRAIGKPFGRLRRGETPAKCFTSTVKGSIISRMLK